MPDTRTAIQEIYEAEKELMQARQKVLELRRAVPKDSIEDYTFGSQYGDVSLSALFGDKSDLILIHNMGKSCAYCTLWADGFNGMLNHLKDRAAFVVVSPDAPETQETFAKARNWKFRMLSDNENFTKDMGYRNTPDQPMPGMSTFYKENGKITRVATDFFGPGDDYCSLWHMFDLLKDGQNKWQAKFEYN